VAFSINKSDGVTAVSRSLREQTYALPGVRQEIEVIYNFIDFERFKRDDKDHFKKAIAPDGERILVHLSNFRKVKRVADVIRVFHKVRQAIPAKLLLIGDGPERRNAEQLCRELQLCDDLRFLGKQDAVEELLAVSDLMILPSEKESFGLAALEAFACEVPVISSNAGGLPDVNIHGETGFLSNVGDVDDMAKNALKIISDPSTLGAFRKRALQQAKRFHIDNIIPLYEKYYERVLQEAVYSEEQRTELLKEL
jgi:N-acetyl-alpha-D-glucosaminyl L-malate synthase BshA